MLSLNSAKASVNTKVNIYSNNFQVLGSTSEKHEHEELKVFINIFFQGCAFFIWEERVIPLSYKWSLST